MKQMLWLVMAILIIFLLVLFFPTGTNDHRGSSEQTAATEISESNKAEQGAYEEQSGIDEDTRYRLMKEEFAKLEKARRDIKRRLAKLKYHLRDVQLPPAQAREINEHMLNGYKQLRTPQMLGAFSSVAGISEERGRVEYAYANLDEVARILDQYKSVEKTANSLQQ
ncbi:MAG: hypothetical protein V3R68_08225 [Gammaproteobacteria bacterium]